ncbi:hypothetical protein C7S18_10380 [Ahniella affigens]|uniref:IPTL-CTERM protein sorting domain-containing protein n=1 Tax=Ahniella affigens TaxID=2021234 RepID=A0A2P1PRU6_9GAMM|nr:hypothetical protein [Ahniella affigens]AVP97577.1 hypothetical protein C7S18_10380 [Ahniella affigens]
MNRKLLPLSLMAIFATAGSAHAAVLTNRASVGGVPSSEAVRGGSVVLYDQNNSGAGNGVPDQDFEASFDAYDSEAADDFVVPSGVVWVVDEVRTVGTTGTPGGSTVDLTIFANAAGSGDPDLPGAAVAGCTYTNVTPTDTLGSFNIPLSPACSLPAGTYWVAIQTNQNFAASGQHFWSNRSVQSGSESVWRNPGDGFASGCTTFEPATGCGVGGGASPDLLFQIVGTLGPTDVPPVFSYSPAPGSVTLTGGTTVGSTGSANIDVSIATAGSGSGAAATTTVTCTAPAGFTGFAGPVSAIGAGAVNGSPLTGSCVLGAAAVTLSMTCNEVQGTTTVPRVFDLTCPAGTVVPLTSNPTSGANIAFQTTLGGPAATSTIVFDNPGLVAANVTCTAPAAPFTASPLSFAVPASGNATVTVTYQSGSAGSFSGVLACTAGAQDFTFNLNGTTAAPGSVPSLSAWSRWMLTLSVLGFGLLGFGLLQRRS